MADVLQTLKRQRTRMLLINLAYFTALLALGVLLFLKNAGGTPGFVMIAVCLTGYLMLVRPLSRQYLRSMRETLLLHTVCAKLADCEYRSKGGVPAEVVRTCGLVSISADSFMSREHITGRCGTMSVEMADVTFPIVERNRNAMFSGAFVQLTCPGAKFIPFTVQAGQWDHLVLPPKQLALVKELEALIPGSLYLKTAGETMTLLLRGRFLGFRINPLVELTEKTLRANPFPELESAIALAHMMGAHRDNH